MVKSKTNKMHLEITNDVELDVEGTSTSKRNRKSTKVSVISMKTPKIMAIKSSKAGRITKKRGSSKRKMNSSKASSLKSKKLMPLITFKSIPKKKSIKSKPLAFKQGKAKEKKGTLTGYLEAS